MTLLFRQIRRNEKRQGDRSTENIRLHLRGLPQNRYFIRGFALSVCVRLFFPVVFRGQPKWSTSNWIFPQYHNAGSDVFTTAFKSSKSWISSIFGPQSKTLHSRFEGSLKVVADFAFDTDFSVKFSNQMSNYNRRQLRPRPQGPPRVFVNCVLLPTPGNVHDCRVAQRCIETMPPSAEPVAGKGHESRELRERLEERGTGPVIPPRKNRKIRYHDDRAIYRERNIIERMFAPPQGPAAHRNALRAQH